MANYLVNDTQLTSVADAIRAKSGGNTGLAFPSGFISEIGNISTGGGGTASSNDVIFYDDLMNDCQGGIAYSYSAAEFAQLTQMPANPDHSNFVTHGISIPMTSQGWNWSLADAKAYVAKYGKLNIGQMYIPTDGKSHWICYVPLDAPVERWNTVIPIEVADGSVNWQVDDGTINTADEAISVTFPSVGWHDVKISAPNGVTYAPYQNSTSNEVLGKIQRIIQVFLGDDVTYIDYSAFCQYCNLTSITIPDSITKIYEYAFFCCYNLRFITIPDSVTEIYECAFSSCCNLKSVTIPNGVTSINSEAFYNCCSLIFVIIPNGVTSISNGVFCGCYCLMSMIIPNSVRSINVEAFQWCCNLKTIIIESSTPPTLNSTDAFSDLMPDYSIIVPAGSLSDYTSATNWSSLADHIVEATA